MASPMLAGLECELHQAIADYPAVALQDYLSAGLGVNISKKDVLVRLQQLQCLSAQRLHGTASADLTTSPARSAFATHFSLGY